MHPEYFWSASGKEANECLNFGNGLWHANIPELMIEMKA
jgi:hypothetical protein